MPQVALALDVARRAEEVFDFLARPANHVQLVPAEMRLELVQGPERVALGTLLHWKARRMGVSQTLVNEVTAFEECTLIAEQQRQGPFKQWHLLHRIEATPSGTRLAAE